MALSAVNLESLISRRSRSIDVSGIRRVFELGTTLKDPINLSIGQPDFPVPEPLKAAAIRAIESDRNGYTLTQGAAELLDAVSRHLLSDVGWLVPSDDLGLLITSGTSGAILLAFLATLDPGDEVIVGDPYFVIYPAFGPMTGARVVCCDTYPDCRLTAERIEPLITDKTKLVLLNSPGNPSGVVLTNAEIRDIVDLCERRGILLVSDEIYDEFTYEDARENGKCPSPARFTDRMILVRGFGKTYGCTGWRLGYAAGPRPLMAQIAKLQQYSYVCAPSMAQSGVVPAFGVDMSKQVAAYQRKRDMVMQAFDGLAEVPAPGGAFYVFVQVPPQLGLSAQQFVEKAIKQNVLVIPGNVFSRRDTHFRISYAVDDAQLARGLEILTDLMRG